jgi:hypothetical protein
MIDNCYATKRITIQNLLSMSNFYRIKEWTSVQNGTLRLFYI